MAAAQQKMELRQGQSLVMTPQLQQAIKLLTLSNADLVAYVEEEMERNPLLERESDGAPSANADEPRPDGAFEGTEPANTAETLSAAELDLSDHDELRTEALDTDSDVLYGEDSPSDRPADAAGATDWSQAGSGKSFDEDMDFESNLAYERSLHEYLSEQLALAITDPIDRVIGAYLIDLVDDAGYLRADLTEIAELLGIALDRVEGVLTICQRFEPTGVMARSLAECLELQLIEAERLDPEMKLLLAHLDLLGRGELKNLQTILDVDRQTLQELIGELRSLKPKPGMDYGPRQTNVIVPDVFVRQAPGGDWLVELNNDAMPRVLVNQRYVAQVSAAAKSEADRVYVQECAANASWLTKSLDQRARTILKVAQEIVRQQDSFLVHGVAFLKPLNLKTVAAAIDMHESTVSRVTTAKWIHTPRGIFELKYFFTASIASADGGDAYSAEAVRFRIKSLIDQETPREILSDDRIVELLRETGIEIARRTVAKYREAMRIPSSLERKRRCMEDARGAA